MTHLAIGYLGGEREIWQFFIVIVQNNPKTIYTQKITSYYGLLKFKSLHTKLS